MIVFPLKWLPWILAIAGFLGLIAGEPSSLISLLIGVVWLVIKYNKKNNTKISSTAYQASTNNNSVSNNTVKATADAQNVTNSSSINVCPNCNTTIGNGMSFCTKCGTKVR